MEIKREHDIDRSVEVISKRPKYPMSTFKNLGGTCPLNSVLICLLATEKLTKFYKDEESWKNKIRVDLKTMSDEIDKNMKGIIKKEITDKDIEEYIKNSVSDHFLCIIKNYFVKPSVLISPVKFCDTIFNKSTIYNSSRKFVKGIPDTAIKLDGFTPVCKAGGGDSINEFKTILWNMINETCYHINDDEYVTKTLYNLISREDYEKLSEREKEIKLIKLNTINEISFVKINILRYELLRFESNNLVGIKSKKKRSSILEMFGIYKKIKHMCPSCKITIEYKVDVELECIGVITKTSIINYLRYSMVGKSTCPKCGNDEIKNIIYLGLSDIFVINIRYAHKITDDKGIADIHDLLYTEIDLTGCVERCDHDYKYKAYAVVQFTSGHFRSFAKYNNIWFEFNDDYVINLDEKVFINEICRYGIHMLFLERS